MVCLYLQLSLLPAPASWAGRFLALLQVTCHTYTTLLCGSLPTGWTNPSWKVKTASSCTWHAYLNSPHASQA